MVIKEKLNVGSIGLSRGVATCAYKWDTWIYGNVVENPKCL